VQTHPLQNLVAPPPDVKPPPAGAVPPLSAAESLAAAPFFDDLSAVDLARLVPDLEEYHLSPGQVVFA
jgi:hypothetical protein